MVNYKYILQRILIGVGIALILMFLKKGLILNVNALESSSVETQELIPNNLQMTFTSTNGTTSTRNYSIETLTDSYFPGNTFYGKRGTGSGISLQQLTWRFDGSTLSNGYYDISFLYYSFLQSSPYLNGNTFSFYNNGKYYNCETSNYNIFPDTTLTAVPYTQIRGVVCRNVWLSDNNNIYLNYYLEQTTNLDGNGYGISKTTFLFNSANSNDLIYEETKKQSEEQEKTNDLLEDDSVDNDKADNDIADMQSKVASNSSITQLLTLPISLYQSILNSVNGSCSSFNLGSLYNHELTLPCINLQSLLGSTLYGIIDVLISGLFILSFRKKMVDIFNNMTSLNDRGNELE